MRDREEIGRMVREEIAASEKDPVSAAQAREDIAAEDEADRLLRHAREARGTPVPDEDG